MNVNFLNDLHFYPYGIPAPIGTCRSFRARELQESSGERT